MRSYFKIHPLRYWVQKVLPLVYDDSLSYYELLSKVVAKINEITDSQNTLIDLLEQNLGDYVKEILEEWLDDGTIAGILNNLVIVNDYGAKGDGVTDDTEAIQRCIDENPCATIMFKRGTYIITRTIELWGASGGQYVLFGGCTLKWDGVSSNNTAMVLVEKDYYAEDGSILSSMCRLMGGNFNGNGKAGVCIINHAFYTDIGYCKLFDFTNTGIINGTLTYAQDKSTQAKIHNCHIFMRDYGEYSLEGTVGIAISCPDNHISEIVTNRLGIAFKLIVGGNTFTNCHTTVEYKDITQLTIDTYGGVHISVEPVNSGATQENVFIGCYFNVGKYVVNAPIRASSLITSIYDSHYTFYGTNKLTFNNGYGVLCGGFQSAINVDNFDVLIGGNYNFFGYMPTNGSVSMGGVPKKFNITHSRRHPEAHILNAYNLCNITTEPIMIAHANYPIPSANEYYEVGAIFLPYVEESSLTKRYMGTAIIEVNSLEAYNVVVIGFDDELKPIIVAENTTRALNNKKFYVSETPKLFTIDGKSYAYYPVYLNWELALNERTTMKIYGTTPYVQGFVRFGVTANNKIDTVGSVIRIFENSGITVNSRVVSSSDYLALLLPSNNGIRLEQTEESVNLTPTTSTIEHGKFLRLGTSGPYRIHDINISDYISIGNTQLNESQLMQLLELIQ